MKARFGDMAYLELKAGGRTSGFECRHGPAKAVP